MTPAIFALILHLAIGTDVTIGNYYYPKSCFTARDAIKASSQYTDTVVSAECKMIKFNDVIYE